MTKVLFICHGNICRSAMSEFIMRDMVEKQGLSDQIQVASDATSREEIGNDMYPPAKRKLDKEHIPYIRRQARQVT
ncbi:MAG: low molecular weight phosphotyrosine protein phosphatase, partial [Spirochaetales bacterium]|nr:low molecular weight phosphotyrosine protein phosphatase [Spirochaetales bacterium]